MLTNYLKVALRGLRRNALFTSINVAGLGLGMACCLLIFLFIRDEISYDTHHPEVDRLYRVTYHATSGNDYARVPPPVGPRLPTFFSEVETAARAFLGSVSVRVPATNTGQPEASFEEDGALFVDSTFTDLFDVQTVRGPADIRLTAPGMVVLTEETAARYFGDRDPVGQTLFLEGNRAYRVAAVVADFPPNTHLRFGMLLPYDDMYGLQSEGTAEVMRANLSQNWVISHSFTYARLQPGAQVETVNRRLADLVAAEAPPQLQVGQSFSLMPVRDIHLRSEAFLEPQAPGDIQTIYLFAAVALLTLLLPCFNFINLATAQSMRRTLEIGMRRAMGAQRGQLFGQFLGESLLVCALAFVAAVALAALGLPLLNDLTQKTLPLSVLLDPVVLGGVLLLFVATGLLAGTYPAVLIARTRVIPALRRMATVAPGRRFTLRKVLVTLQFAISTVLLAGTVLIFNQLNYLTDRPLGYASEGVVAVPLFSQNMNNLFEGVDGTLRSTLNAFEEQLAQDPGVRGSTLSRFAPGLGAVSRMTQPEGQEGEDPIFVPAMAVDYDFPSFYGLEMVAGRSFERERGTDHLDAFLVNETAVRRFGWGTPAEALGQTINLEGKEGTVVGVVRDFNFASLRVPINALLLEINVPAFRTVSVRVSTADLSGTLDRLGTLWASFFPDQAFEYVFLDEALEEQYESQGRLGAMLRLFAGLSVVVSCLGAYGLVLISTRQRRREIGVRKVLG
ncbi:MAG: ABC transporter permease, partial [Bacteroidota bacterium]